MFHDIFLITILRYHFVTMLSCLHSMQKLAPKRSSQDAGGHLGTVLSSSTDDGQYYALRKVLLCKFFLNRYFLLPFLFYTFTLQILVTFMIFICWYCWFIKFSFPPLVFLLAYRGRLSKLDILVLCMAVDLGLLCNFQISNLEQSSSSKVWSKLTALSCLLCEHAC